jgi:hypothetical protein
MSLASHSTDWDQRKSVAAGKIPEALTILIYHLVISHSHGKSPFLIGKPSINGLNNQRVRSFC